MKKILITVFFTMALLTAGTVALYSWLRDEGSKEVLKSKEVLQMELDEGKTNTFERISQNEVIPLILEGAGKNVMTYDNKNIFDPYEGVKNYSRLERVKEKTYATFEKPIIAYNPFGTSENTLYFYFKTDNKLAVRYTIASRDNAVVDFSRIALNKDLSSVSDEHEFIVRGIVPGRENYIAVGLYNGEELIEEMVYKFNAKPAVIGKNMIITEKGTSGGQSTNGLYFVFPDGKPVIGMYDNSGILRGEFKQKSASGKRLVITESSFFYPVSKKEIIQVSNFGQIMGVYSFDRYAGVTDFDYDGFENLYVSVIPKGQRKKKNKQNILIRYNIKSKEREQVLELDSGVSFDGITFLGGGKAVISAQKPQGILLISGIASNSPKVTGVLGIKSDWKNTKYAKRVYKLKGKVGAASGQGFIINDEEYTNGEIYRISFINQNTKKKDRSYYYEYEIDSSKKSFTVSEQILLDYAKEGGSGQEYEEHSVVCDTEKGEFGEYDKTGKPIKVFETGFPVWSVIKANLKGNWFY